MIIKEKAGKAADKVKEIAGGTSEKFEWIIAKTIARTDQKLASIGEKVKEIKQ